jgi:pimeloyl-ACP methyl ester carboxylesterase
MLNYIRHGSGAPLLLQHGFLGGAGYWLPVLPTITRHFDVICSDLPGLAGSVDEPVPDTLSGFSDALVALLDVLNIERISMVGHSLGSMVGLQLAIDHPDRLDKLVLYGSASTANLPQRFETFAETINRLASEDIEATLNRVVPTWFTEGEDAVYYSLCRRAGAGVRTDTAMQVLQALSTWDVAGQLGGILCPTLVICGDRDRSTAPEESLHLYRNIARAQLSIVPGCAHNVHLENPERFVQDVLGFLLAA